MDSQLTTHKKLETLKSSKEFKGKIDDLLSRMSLEEKVGQMCQLHKTDDSLEGGVNEAIRKGQVGSIINASNAQENNEFQRIAVEESKLGIPLIMARDVIHGFRTIFPIPLGQAATWNPQLVEKGARIAAIEAASVGIHWTFAPSIDIARDPRWGRIAETFGEDTHLTSVMGAASIKGYQGIDLSNPESIAACAKHFVGYGAAEGGRDYNTAMIPEGVMRDVYLPPFKAALEAGVTTLMCSFNEVNGVPSSGNELLFRQILREEWGFEGFVVSDWESITEMIVHGFCKDEKQAAYKAIKAGIDMEMVSKSYLHHVQDLIQENRIQLKSIDESVRNILSIKFKLGLFDHPYVQEKQTSPILSEAHLAEAKLAATESVVLLKNSKNTLPLSYDIEKIAVIGPLANAPHEQLGTWIFDGSKEDSLTPLEAIRECLGEARVSYSSGLTYSREKNKEGFDAALDAVRLADTIVLFLGEEAIISGEAHARANIDLPGAQTELVDLFSDLDIPLVVVILAGRPLAIGEIAEKADSVLYAWHPGTMAGQALVDLIFGQASPSGKLPVTFPKSAGQIPIYHSHKNTGRPANSELYVQMDDIPVEAAQTSLPNTSQYLDLGFLPLYPFGFGLSYTTFKYSNLTLDKKSMNKSETLTVAVDLTNTGNRQGEEVVQLYIRDLVGSLTRPVKELKGFQKCLLQPGEHIAATFELTENDFAFHSRDMTFRAEAGVFKIYVGGNSNDTLEKEFTLF